MGLFCYGIAFVKAGSWSFGCNFVRNVIIFGVDNRLLSHSNNRKINFLVLDGGSTYDINCIFNSPQKLFSINFCRENILHYVYVTIIPTVIYLLKENKYIS